MKTQARRSPYLPLLIVGIVVIVFSTAGIAAIMRWLPASTDGSGDPIALVNLPESAQKDAQRRAESGAGTGSRCPGCGVIVSMRELGKPGEEPATKVAVEVIAGNRDEIKINPDKSYEIIVRMADQSRRVLTHASPASWRPGERVVVIGGLSLSDR